MPHYKKKLTKASLQADFNNLIARDKAKAKANNGKSIYDGVTITVRDLDDENTTITPGQEFEFLDPFTLKPIGKVTGNTMEEVFNNSDVLYQNHYKKQKRR